MLNFRLLHPKMTQEHLGYIPTFLHESDPRSAKDQFDTAYKHGGGWSPFEGFALLPNGNLKYPGDEPTKLLAEAKFRNETIRFYEHSWVLILQEDGTWEVSRMD